MDSFTRIFVVYGLNGMMGGKNISRPSSSSPVDSRRGDDYCGSKLSIFKSKNSERTKKHLCRRSQHRK